MIISIIKLVISIPEARSLKDKRKVVKSIKDRLIQKFKLSAAEVEDMNSIRTAVIAAAIVSNSKVHGETVLHKALTFVEDAFPGYLYETKIFSEFF
ncbi:MAG: DUF503 domain-containing protein [Spirochaetales bacterium]|nr:DUF503 domain-containing protein [Spirochaetales bacterium]